MDNQNNVVVKEQPYDVSKPSELYLTLKREPDPMGPPESCKVYTQVDWQNFPNPMEVLNALEIAKATVVNIMIQQQQAQAQKNPNFGRPPWVKGHN